MTLILIKIIATVSIVLGLSVVAERLSTRWAGMLGGYPLGTALVLIFIGYQEGAGFAANSVVHTLAGLTANVGLFAAYGLVLALRPKTSVLLTSVIAVSAFFALAIPLSWVEFSLTSATLFILFIVGVCIIAFKRFPDMKITQAVRLSLWVTFVRAAMACFVVLTITGLAEAMGPEMAGVMASFPSTVFPLVVIMHFTYGPAPVLTIIKHFPKGLGAMITFGIVYALYLEQMGLLVGTAVSFGAATVYLLGFSFAQQKMRRKS